MIQTFTALLMLLGDLQMKKLESGGPCLAKKALLSSKEVLQGGVCLLGPESTDNTNSRQGPITLIGPQNQRIIL